MASCSVGAVSNQCLIRPCNNTGDGAKYQGLTKDRFLIVDGDRAQQGDCSIEKLKREAARYKFTVCVQSPNHEGLLLRMMPGMEREIPDAASSETKLKKRWPNYQKPVNAHALGRQFSVDDLMRIARVDPDLENLLRQIGLITG